MEIMGHFTAIGMRTPIDEPDALIITTCSDNDTTERGDEKHWSWSNPTNRKFGALYIPPGCGTVRAVSTEALWQGTKIFARGGTPDSLTLEGDWRRGKAKRPIGAWNGPDRPLITSPGHARRAIYIPAYRNQIQSWLSDTEAQKTLANAWRHKGNVYLRDYDTGRGIDQGGPMSHAWLLATWLNTGSWTTK